MKKTLLIAVLAIGSLTYLSMAQDQGQGQGGGRRGPRGADGAPAQGGPGGGPGRGGRGGPLLGALDANHDGELDATEIANASKALLSLDKNGDGKLTADELRPAGGGPRGGHDKAGDAQK